MSNIIKNLPCFPNMLSRFQRASSPRQTIILLGQEGSGKTTLLHRLKYGDAPTATPPGLYCQAETVIWKGQQYQILDIGGDGLSFRTQPQLKAFMDLESVVFFLVDSSTSDFKDAAQLLKEHLPQMLCAGVRFLWIIANKQDLVSEKASPTSKDAFREEFYNLLRPFRGQIMMCIADSGKFSGLTGTGVSDLLDQIPVFLHNHVGFRRLTMQCDTTAKAPCYGELLVPGSSKVDRYDLPDVKADIFIEYVRNQRIALDTHWSQLQMAYLALLECIKQGEGVFDAAEFLISNGWFGIESNREPHR
jgi:ADP-ribosylation factor 1/2